jgi:hypothetical protein
MILFGPIRAYSCPIFPREPEIASFDSHGLFVEAYRTLRSTIIANFQSSCGYARGKLLDIEKYGHSSYLYTCRQHNEELGISCIPAWVAFGIFSCVTTWQNSYLVANYINFFSNRRDFEDLPRSSARNVLAVTLPTGSVVT